MYSIFYIISTFFKMNSLNYFILIIIINNMRNNISNNNIDMLLIIQQTGMLIYVWRRRRVVIEAEKKRMQMNNKFFKLHTTYIQRVLRQRLLRQIFLVWYIWCTYISWCYFIILHFNFFNVINNLSTFVCILLLLTHFTP